METVVTIKMNYLELLCVVILLIIICFILLKSVKSSKSQKLIINGFKDILKTFIDADNSLIYLKDENLKYIYVNKALEEFYNRKSSEIIGRDVFDFADSELASISKRIDLEALEKKSVVVHDEKWKNKILQKTKFPVRLNNGEYGVGAYIRDVTEEFQNKTELMKAYDIIKENEEKLELILNSTYEAVYGIDKNGNCTFCNKSCLELLRYKKQEDLIGKNIHLLIHHSHMDGSQLTNDDCKVLTAYKKGVGVHVEDEVYWRSDGTFIEVEYFSYPQYKDGEVIGVVVTFVDITSRRKSEKENIYLNNHDSLTGLYNRRYYEEELNRLDKESNLPISIIMADVNGLKQTNDIFGHSAGDLLIKKAAEILKSECRKDDIIVRLGGDEFIVILINTSKEEVEDIANRIKINISKERVEAFTCSISVGCDTKVVMKEDIMHVIDNADEYMYSEKVLDRKNNSSTSLKEIIQSFYKSNSEEEGHSIRVSELCQKIGRFMGLSESETRRLKEAGLLHDIGKIVIKASLLNKRNKLNDREWQLLKRHTVVGYRILNSYEETLELAKYILSHHERWDGTGYPKGLIGEAIPKVSRIIALAESYDLMINGTSYKKALSKEEAISEIKINAGTQFDPELAEIFINMQD